ncbi:MAG: helix-turn-helix transcriptional regulator [Acidimicrobiia bacterium]
MEAVRELRRTVGLTQAELARAAGTSQPTIAAYESGTKSPTLRTLSRMARAVGLESVVVFPPAMTREDRRSLALHRAIADHLKAHPVETLDRARRNLTAMRTRNPQAAELFTEWDDILTRPVEAIVTAMLDPTLRARDLRKVTPFAGVLEPRERTRVYREFARRDAAA